eukprot:TRINITY_DN26990_c0_g3_i1.p1 TRINITY_DN26990_c0_g3~~TRINITY_DN26990_c0_g3_i1.p1  ORF type:complete len:256 (+),score=39.36 TRINITY_DN26990_c0_g3_i1:36-770(+)
MAETRQLDCCATPWNAMKIHEEALLKEEKAYAIRAAKKGAPRALHRLQLPGEEVVVFNIASQPHLNGVRGEVVSSRADPNGYVLVKVPKNVHRHGVDVGRDGWRQLKVQPRCLQPCRGPSDKRARGGLLRNLEEPDGAASLASFSACFTRSAPSLAGRSAVAQPRPAASLEMSGFAAEPVVAEELDLCGVGTALSGTSRRSAQPSRCRTEPPEVVVGSTNLGRTSFSKIPFGLKGARVRGWAGH